MNQEGAAILRAKLNTNRIETTVQGEGARPADRQLVATEVDPMGKLPKAIKQPLKELQFVVDALIEESLRRTKAEDGFAKTSEIKRRANWQLILCGGSLALNVLVFMAFVIFNFGAWVTR